MSGTTKLMTPGGGGVNLTPASSIASDVTVNIPSQDCTLGIQGPAFSAYLGSAQTLSAATLTKIQINTEEFDTANCFDNTTNYRFQPNIAGYYQVNANIGSNTAQSTQSLIYKNGTQYKAGNNSNSSFWSGVSCLVYMNGSTDYIEFYGYMSTGAALNTGANITYFQASMVRAA